MHPLPRLLLLACVAPTLFAAAPVFKAGAFAEDITPKKLPSPINGNMKGAFSNSVTDPMHARALALHDGSRYPLRALVPIAAAAGLAALAAARLWRARASPARNAPA